MNRAAMVLGLAAVLTAGGGSAGAQETEAYWARPVQAELAEQLYPGFAALLGESGRVTLRCPIEADGPPYLCEVLEEAPRGLGFGAAARVMATSAEVGAKRRDGMIVPGPIQFSVHFRTSDRGPLFGGWTGPEPTPATLALAREMVEGRADDFPPSYRETMMNGLDFDRRQIVGAWIDELMPHDPVRQTDILTLQAARLFDEKQLRRILAGETVNAPSFGAFYAASPDPTPEEAAAMAELKRRYCDRWECGVDSTGQGS